MTLGAGESAVREDVLRSLFGFNPPVVGSLLATSPTSAGGLAWMRTYTEEPVAGGEFETYGQAIGPRDQGAVITTGSEGRVAGFSHDAGSRANLILQNTRIVDGAYATSMVRVEVMAADGRVIAQRDYALDPGEYYLTLVDGEAPRNLAGLPLCRSPSSRSWPPHPGSTKSTRRARACGSRRP